MNCKLPIDYILYEITDKEIDYITNQYQYNYQEEWEKTRWLGYIFASTMTDKLKKPSDLIKFEWEIEEIDNTTLNVNEDNKETIEHLIKIVEERYG